MNKLIEIEQQDLIVCDSCDYRIPNDSGNPNVETIQFVNMPCPQCGENLLTEKDYTDSQRLLSVINFINKYFSWMAYFSKKERKKVSVHIHDGLRIE